MKTHVPPPHRDRLLRNVRADLEAASGNTVIFHPGHDGMLTVKNSPYKPMITLAMIARDDAHGLTRAIISALPHVDRIVIGVDERSDTATYDVADAWADKPIIFKAADLKMLPQDWISDRMNFAAARNIVLDAVETDWVLTIDTDEYITKAPKDIRALIAETERGQPEADCIPATFIDGHNTLAISQRVARSSLRWERETHNELPTKVRAKINLGLTITQDRSLRSEASTKRRDEQRADAIEAMMDAAKKDDRWAMFHVLKELIGDHKMTEARKMLTRYVAITDAHGPETEGRSYLCTAMAITYYQQKNFEEAEYWATVALRDGPRIEAFGLLGSIAEGQGRLYQALGWFQAEAACPNIWHHRWTNLIKTRHERRDALLRRLTAAALKLEGNPGPKA